MLYVTTSPSTSCTTAWARATISFPTGVKHRFPAGCAEMNIRDLRAVFADFSSQESAHQARHGIPWIWQIAPSPNDVRTSPSYGKSGRIGGGSLRVGTDFGFASELITRGEPS